jgi:hypothetical protein
MTVGGDLVWSLDILCGLQKTNYFFDIFSRLLSIFFVGANAKIISLDGACLLKKLKQLKIKLMRCSFSLQLYSL